VAEELLSDAEDVARGELLLAGHLAEHTVQRAQIANDGAGGVDDDLGVVGREIAIVLEERAVRAADPVLAFLEVVLAALGAVGADQCEATVGLGLHDRRDAPGELAGRAGARDGGAGAETRAAGPAELEAARDLGAAVRTDAHAAARCDLAAA